VDVATFDGIFDELNITAPYMSTYSGAKSKSRHKRALASQETHCFFLYSFITEALVCDCGIVIPELAIQVRRGGNCGGE
jgi:hypothetical protein